MSAADFGFPADAVEVGRVVDAWGVKGWIKVQPYSADATALLASPCWFVHGREPRALHVTQVRMQGDCVIAAAEELADRDAAEVLRGAALHVSRASFPVAAVDEYYWVDLIGLVVVNREGALLGTVAGLIDTGAHSVLRVSADDAGEERLIPFVAACIDHVDLEARRITVDWGLDY